MKEIILKTDDIDQDHRGSNNAFLDRQTQDALGVQAGDMIEIEGSKTTSAIVGDANAEEEGRQIISIDCVTAQNAGVGFGRPVKVRRSEVRAAKVISVAVPADETRRYHFRDHVKKQIQKDLLGRCVMKGDLVLLHNVSTVNFFRLYRTEPLLKVIDTDPLGVVCINDSTNVRFGEETVVKTEIWIGDEGGSSDA
jgi:transitional endoplasmic reticulum ATPase